MRAVVTADVLDPAALELESSASGAVVTFVGRVRDHDGGRSVVALEYSAHPTAPEVLQEIAASCASADPVLSLAVAHRTGALVVGDVALVAVVATAHRAAAFEHCSLLVERVKHELPMWKRQVFQDGTEEWVGSC